MRRNRILTSALLIFILAMACRRGIDEKDIIARVGGAVLTTQEIEARMTREGYQSERESDFVNHWVNRELLYQEAVRQHLDDDADLRHELELLKKEYVIQKLLEKTYKEKLQITEEELSSYYNENSADFEVLEDEVKIQHILTETREDAQLALQEINAGKDMAEVAKERSVGMFKDRGGNVGYISRNDVIREVERYAFNYAVGSTSRVISSDHGFHIIKILNKRSAGTPKPLDEVRNEIWQRLRTLKENQLYYDILYELQNQNSYTINKSASVLVKADSVAVTSQEQE